MDHGKKLLVCWHRLIGSESLELWQFNQKIEESGAVSNPSAASSGWEVPLLGKLQQRLVVEIP